MPDTTILPAIAYAIDGDDVAAEPRTVAPLDFLLAYMVGFKNLTRHQSIIKRLTAELVWASAESRRIDPNWTGFRYPHAEDLADRGDRLPHERAAAEALNAWGHCVGHNADIRSCKVKLLAQRKASVDWKRGPAYTAQWFIAARLTEEDLRAHWRARRVAWRTFLLALRLYRELRANVDPSPTGAACTKEAA
jgi:hypothetical protein